jgi:hypothetical protein
LIRGGLGWGKKFTTPARIAIVLSSNRITYYINSPGRKVSIFTQSIVVRCPVPTLLIAFLRPGLINKVLAERNSKNGVLLKENRLAKSQPRIRRKLIENRLKSS